MKTPVVHVNLLQKTAPRHTVGPAFLALLVATLASLGWYASGIWHDGAAALVERDALARQATDLQARIAALASEQERNAGAIALRKEIEQLQWHAQGSKALVEALRNSAAGRSEDFARALSALAGTAESGVWLTGVDVQNGGTKLQVRGEARDSASVLRFARRVNEALRGLSLRMDQLEIQPAARTAGAGPATGLVAFVMQ